MSRLSKGDVRMLRKELDGVRGRQQVVIRIVEEVQAVLMDSQVL